MPINVKSPAILDAPARDLLLRAQAAALRRGPGAAVRTSRGTVHVGSAFVAPGGAVRICAEAAALAGAWSAGEAPTEIAVVAEADHPGAGPVAPCGQCRSLLAALAHDQGREIVVYLADAELGRVVLTTSGELLPLTNQG